MTLFLKKIADFFSKEKAASTDDPVSTFFLHTKSRAKKRVYISALKKAQKDQEDVVRLAKEKALAH